MHPFHHAIARSCRGSIRCIPDLCMACLALTLMTPALTAQPVETPTPLQIITDERADSGVLFATRIMAIRYEAITAAPVTIRDSTDDRTVLATYLDQMPDDGALLLFTHRHLIEMLSDPDGGQLADLVLLARGLSTPQVLVSRCDRFVDVGTILSEESRDRIRFGVAGRVSFDALTARAFWQRLHARDPIVVPAHDHAGLIDALHDDQIDLAIMSLATASRETAGSFCRRLLLATESPEQFPDLPTAASFGIPVSMIRFAGYIARPHGSAEARQDLAGTLTDSMRSVAYGAFLAHNGLDANSVAGSEKWSAQIQAMIKTLTPLLSGATLATDPD